MTTTSSDVVVIGGGPGGVAAALTASRRGASVVLVEQQRLGGTCVHDACIPFAAMLDAMERYLAVSELDALGITSMSDGFSFDRALARKDALVSMLAKGVARTLERATVQVVGGHAQLTGSGSVIVRNADGDTELDTGAVVIAAGSTWRAPAIDGVPTAKIHTPEVLLSRSDRSGRLVVLGGGPSANAFAFEQAFLLAGAGRDVTFLAPTAHLLPGLDNDLQPYAAAALDDLGIRWLVDARVTEGDSQQVRIEAVNGATDLVYDAILMGDPRGGPPTDLGVEHVGLTPSAPLEVDERCATGAPGVFAVGDVTGVGMLSSTAAHQGAVAGANALDGDTAAALTAVPRVLHTEPEIAWVGLDEASARTARRSVAVGAVDLGHSALAITRGARTGGIKLVADAELGEIIGVHAVGPGAHEIVAVATALIQSEIAVDDLASTAFWHPSGAENLIDAARQVLGVS